MESATPASAVEAPASTAVTTMLAECRVWCEGKTCESSERNEGPNQTKSTHNLSFPSGV
jgi:hypothetical protein